MIDSISKKYENFQCSKSIWMFIKRCHSPETKLKTFCHFLLRFKVTTRNNEKISNRKLRGKNYEINNLWQFKWKFYDDNKNGKKSIMWERFEAKYWFKVPLFVEIFIKIRFFILFKIVSIIWFWLYILEIWLRKLLGLTLRSITDGVSGQAEIYSIFTNFWQLLVLPQKVFAKAVLWVQSELRDIYLKYYIFWIFIKIKIDSFLKFSKKNLNH